MKKIKISLISFLIFLCTLLPFSHFSPLRFFKAQADFHEIKQNETWSGSKEIDNTILVDPGVTLTIAKGANIKFKGYQSGIIVGGKLEVKGTVVNPVRFSLIGEITADNFYNITVYDQGEAEFRNAEITKGGYYDDFVPVLTFLDKVKKFFLGGKTYAGSLTPAITVYEGGKLEMQACNLHNNAFAIGIYPLDPNIGVNTSCSSNDVKVNRSKFVANQYKDVLSKNNLNYNFQYNWWASAEGPNENKLEGRVNTNNFTKTEDFHDPVIIVPGILGSAKENGQWVIDPVGHTYDNLYSEFANNGYTSEKDLFTFGYDWENSNIDTAKLLQKKIQEVKQITNWPKVDIVAHSMGGLVARQYIESADYQDDVDQLITLGSPNNGAPEAYLKWEGDAWFWGVADLYAKHILNQEIKESNKKYTSRFDYIRNKPITSLQELLPVYNYLQNIEDNNKYETYPNEYPRNTFLENLNSEQNIQKLNQVEFDKIVGDVKNNNGTIAGFKIIKADMGKYWQNGYPLGFEIPIGDRGLIKGDGDRTVPLKSAMSANVPSDNTIIFNSVHSALPSKSQKDILELLTKKRPDTEVKSSIIKNILIAQAMSPINIQIIAPDGKWIGKNIKNLPEDNKIVGAYYTGYDTPNEFATIPNPQDGEYKVITQGTGEGDYKVAITKIDEDENNSGQATEVTADITGTTTTGKIETTQAEITENKITVEPQDITPPTLKITSPENKDYLNNQKLKIVYAVTDNLTKADKIKTTLNYDSQLLTSKEIDLSLEPLGKHKLKILVQDEVKNQTEKKVNFQVVTNLKAIRQNIYHYRKLKLIKNQRVVTILERRLAYIQRMDELFQRLEKNWFPQWYKKRIKHYFHLQKKHQIESLVRMINRNHYFRKNIVKEIRVILVEDLKSLEE